MTAHAGDAGVFIRSMATRGHLGGLSRATSDVALVLDAAGKDVVIIETVGVGQDEVDIVRTADVSIVRRWCPGRATTCRRSRRASWRSPTSSSSTRRIARAPTALAQAIAANLSLQTFAAGRDWKPPILKTEATRRRRRGRAVEADRPLSRALGGPTGGAAPRSGRSVRLRELLARTLRAAGRSLAAGRRVRAPGRSDRGARDSIRIAAVER